MVFFVEVKGSFMPVLKTGSCLLHRRPESPAASMIGKSEVPGNNLTEGFLFRVIRAGGITRCRPDTWIAFGDQIFCAQRFIGCIAPEFAAYPFMQTFSKRLGQTIRCITAARL